MEKLLRGAPVAAALEEKLKTKAAALREQGVTPTLAIVRAGAQEGDLAYQRSIQRRAERLGVETVCFELPGDCTQQALLDVIDRVNGDGAIHGCLLLRPLPKQVDERAVCDALWPEKDMDCVSTGALARVFTNRTPIPPCTAQACMEILDFYGVDPAGKRAVVVGRSLVIGKPVAMLLLARNATVTVGRSARVLPRGGYSHRCGRTGWPDRLGLPAPRPDRARRGHPHRGGRHALRRRALCGGRADRAGDHPRARRRRQRNDHAAAVPRGRSCSEMTARRARSPDFYTGFENPA